MSTAQPNQAPLNPASGKTALASIGPATLPQAAAELVAPKICPRNFDGVL